MAPRTPSVSPSPEASPPEGRETPAAGPQAAPLAEAAPASIEAPVYPRNPDAILFPAALRRGKTIADRLGHIQRTLGPRLGGDQHTALGKDHGGRVYSRDVGGGMYLATLAPDDALLFPKDHDRAGEPRYRWEDQPDGTRHGWLVEDGPAP